MAWDNLNLSDRDSLMKIYIKSGIRNLSEMKSHYNQYAEGGLLSKDKNLPFYFADVSKEIKEAGNGPIDMDNANFALNYLKRNGMSDKQASVVIGNFSVESNMNPKSREDNGRGPGVGYEQRKIGTDRHLDAQKYYRNTGANPQYNVDAQKQLEYVVKVWREETENLRKNPNAQGAIHKNEWTHGGKGSGYTTFKEPLNIFNNPDADIKEMSEAFRKGYLRPNPESTHADRRMKISESLLKAIKDSRMKQ